MRRPPSRSLGAATRKKTWPKRYHGCGDRLWSNVDIGNHSCASSQGAPRVEEQASSEPADEELTGTDAARGSSSGEAPAAAAEVPSQPPPTAAPALEEQGDVGSPVLNPLLHPRERFSDAGWLLAQTVIEKQHVNGGCLKTLPGRAAQAGMCGSRVASLPRAPPAARPAYPSALPATLQRAKPNTGPPHLTSTLTLTLTLTLTPTLTPALTPAPTPTLALTLALTLTPT